MEWECIGLICMVVALTQMFTMYILNNYSLEVHIYILGLPVVIVVAIKILDKIANKMEGGENKVE